MEPKIMAHNGILGTLQPCTISDVCRLCANLDSNMIPIYADEGIVHMLENKIKIHLPFINISKNDLLPKRVCYHCASAVLVWNELYECSSDADQRLRSMFEAANSYNLNECKVQYDDIEGIHVPVKDFIVRPIEYEEITDVNLFNKNDKSDKTLNELDKVPSTSKSECILSHEDKSSDIQEDERLNPTVKSDISDLFNAGIADVVDSEDPNVFLNPPGIDEEINGLMDCHRLDMSGSDDCVLLEPKREFMEDEEMDNKVPSVTSEQDQVDQKPNSTDLNSSSNDNTITTDNAMDTTDENDIGQKRRRSLVVGNNGEVSRLVKNKGGGGSCDADDDDDDDDDDNEDDDGDDLDPNLEVRQLYVSPPDDANSDDNEQHETMCPICATVFKTRYNLLRHFQKRHPEFKMYECDLCRISFPSIDEFKDHLEEKHSKMHTTHSADSKQVRFACEVCGNMYKNKASAMNHLLTHTAKKTVQCTLCDFSCYTKQQLGVHQTKHDKRFVCDICSKRFAQKSQLDVHVNAVHYNQRPYACVLCKKTFKTKGSHDAHMIVHTDTRNYQCPHCDKKCRKRYDLTLHIRTHTGEKPFKCTVCGRGFVQMCDTRKHEMLHFRPGKRKNAMLTGSDTAGGASDDE